jgi:hypothetical protein
MGQFAFFELPRTAPSRARGCVRNSISMDKKNLFLNCPELPQALFSLNPGRSSTPTHGPTHGTGQFEGAVRWAATGRPPVGQWALSERLQERCDRMNVLLDCSTGDSRKCLG